MLTKEDRKVLGFVVESPKSRSLLIRINRLRPPLQPHVYDPRFLRRYPLPESLLDGSLEKWSNTLDREALLKVAGRVSRWHLHAIGITDEMRDLISPGVQKRMEEIGFTAENLGRFIEKAHDLPYGELVNPFTKDKPND